MKKEEVLVTEVITIALGWKIVIIKRVVAPVYT
jgi:hypothetical protein